MDTLCHRYTTVCRVEKIKLFNFQKGLLLSPFVGRNIWVFKIQIHALLDFWACPASQCFHQTARLCILTIIFKYPPMCVVLFDQKMGALLAIR